MNDVTQWQENNDKYLSEALKWLRLRLARIAESNPAAAEASQRTRLFGKKSGESTRTVGDKEIERAFEAVTAAESAEPPPAMHILSERFGLSRFEAEVLLLCAAMELDTRIANLCARAQDDPNRPYPTFALALTLFEEPLWEALSPERPLRYWRLIEINQPGAQPLTTSALRADERIVNYLKGLNYLDDRVAPLLMPLSISAGNAELPPSQREAVETIVNHLEGAHTASRPPVVQLLGNDTLSKQLVTRRAAEQLKLRLYRLPAELLPAQAAELETLARLWKRESILLPVALYLDTHDLKETAPTEGQALPLHRFLARSNGFFFLDTRDIQPGLGRAAVTLDIAKPTPAEQEAAWNAGLGDTAPEKAALLAGQFNLNIAAIRQITERALAEKPKNGEVLQEQLWDACLSSTRPRLDVLAQRLDPKATWEDLVLPEEEESLLHQIADQVGQRSRVYDEWGFRQKMNRGLGINALFAGDSGTGKTMAAEVIANDLRLNLYRIDLSAVVSKFIGETEKNLRRLFDAAEDGGAILFFDEADALFGKRSEVKDSHDRYANIEINYLLQRMEAYRGLAILATNMKSALDQAFMRRLRFIVNFPFPGPQQRKAIWQKIFPDDTPYINLDYDRLARLNLTGGAIHNIALNAAFLAARADTDITMPLVLTAARAEFRKLERPLRETDFLWIDPMRTESDKLQIAFKKLENLSNEEYNMSIEEVMTDEDRDEYDRLWRVGRLIGISLKEPFAKPQPQDPALSATGAHRAWVLEDDSFSKSENQQKWQYKVLESIVADSDLRQQAHLGPEVNQVAELIIRDFSNRGQYKDPQALANILQSWFSSDTAKAEQVANRIIEDDNTAKNYSRIETLANFLQKEFSADLVRIAAQEMQSERGFFRCLALSANKYICQSETVKEKLNESLEQSGGSKIFVSPQVLMGSAAVSLANALIDAVPWLLPAHLPIIVGIMILIGNVSLDGFCMWVNEYVSKKELPAVES